MNNPKKKEDIHKLDPITKYSKYGIFPYKMIIHLLLVIFTTIQVILLISNNNIYSRSQENFIYNLFISQGDELSKEKLLYSVKEVKRHVENTINSYFTIDDNSLEMINDIDDDINIYMDVSFLSIKDKLLKHKNVSFLEYYTLKKKDLGPFNQETKKLSLFLKSISEFSLNFTLEMFIPNEHTNTLDCTQWNIHQIYNFKNRGFYKVSLNLVKQQCQNIILKKSSSMILFMDSLKWVHLIVLILANLSLYFTWNYIGNMASLFIRVREKNKIIMEHEPQSDNSIYYNPLIDEEQDEYRSFIQNYINNPKPKKKKMHFDQWSIICLLGNIIQIFSSIISLFASNMITTEFLIGFGCFFSYLYLGKYIEYAKDYSTIYITIKKSLPNVVRYLIGVCPIFLGYMMFGYCVFWRNERFKSLNDVIIILYSMANGDSLYDVFKELSGISFFIGQIYLYSFTIIFITVVLNIFIAIVQEAYNNSEYVKNSNLNVNKKFKEKDGVKFSNDKFNENEDEKPIFELNEPKIEKENIKDDDDFLSHSMKNVFFVDSKFKDKKFSEKNIKTTPTIDVEFENINQKIEELTKIASEYSNKLKRNERDELRENVFELIDDNVMAKIKEIKSFLQN